MHCITNRISGIFIPNIKHKKAHNVITDLAVTFPDLKKK